MHLPKADILACIPKIFPQTYDFVTEFSWRNPRLDPPMEGVEPLWRRGGCIGPQNSHWMEGEIGFLGYIFPSIVAGQME